MSIDDCGVAIEWRSLGKAIESARGFPIALCLRESIVSACTAPARNIRSLTDDSTRLSDRARWLADSYTCRDVRSIVMPITHRICRGLQHRSISIRRSLTQTFASLDWKVRGERLSNEPLRIAAELSQHGIAISDVWQLGLDSLFQEMLDATSECELGTCRPTLGYARILAASGLVANGAGARVDGLAKLARL